MYNIRKIKEGKYLILGKIMFVRVSFNPVFQFLHFYHFPEFSSLFRLFVQLITFSFSFTFYFNFHVFFSCFFSIFLSFCFLHLHLFLLLILESSSVFFPFSFYDLPIAFLRSCCSSSCLLFPPKSTVFPVSVNEKNIYSINLCM